MITEKAKYSYDEVKITDKCKFSEGSNKKIICKNLGKYRKCVIT